MLASSGQGSQEEDQEGDQKKVRRCSSCACAHCLYETDGFHHVFTFSRAKLGLPPVGIGKKKQVEAIPNSWPFKAELLEVRRHHRTRILEFVVKKWYAWDALPCTDSSCACAPICRPQQVAAAKQRAEEEKVQKKLEAAERRKYVFFASHAAIRSGRS